MSHCLRLAISLHYSSHLQIRMKCKVRMCFVPVVCNLKGSIIHIINLSLNAAKRVGFLIKMGLEVFNCRSNQNTIKVYKDWLSSHHDTGQASTHRVLGFRLQKYLSGEFYHHHTITFIWCGWKKILSEPKWALSKGSELVNLRLLFYFLSNHTFFLLTVIVFWSTLILQEYNF